MANRTVTKLTAVLQMNNTKFKKGVSGSQSAMKGLSKSMMNLGGTLAAAFSVRAITNFTRASFKALDTQLKAEQSLLVALNGRITAQQTLIKLSQDLQKTTLYGDEETIRAAALVGTMVKEEETIKRLLPLIQDFATAKGMQLSAAADLVAKSIGSSTNALSRYGITITGAVGSSERLETMVNALTKAFGGQAEAAAEADRMLTQVKNAWGDLGEEFANWLSEGEGGFISRGLLAGIEDLQRLFSPRENKEALSALENFMESIKDKAPEKQAELLTEEIKRQHQAVWDLAETRKQLNKDLENYTGKFARQKRIDTEQQIDLIDQEQDQLIATRHIFEGQVKALKNVGSEIDNIVGKLPGLKTVAAHILPAGFEQAFSSTDVLQQLNWDIDPTTNVTKAYDDATKALYGLSAGLDEWFASTFELSDETIAKVEKVESPVNDLGKMVGMSLVSQFDRLGESIGKFATGAEDSFRGLGDAIMQNLGNILIMMGAQHGNIPMVLAGAAIQLGGGVLRGLGSKGVGAAAGKEYYGGGNSVNFRISGKDLVGTLERQNYSNYMNT